MPVPHASKNMFAMVLALVATSLIPTLARAAVTVDSTDRAYTLSNGTLTAVINRRSGGLISLKYNNLEMLNNNGGIDSRDSGFWSHTPEGDATTSSITIDPKTGNGDRAEVSIRGDCGGQAIGSHSPGGGAIADIEIRYALAANDSALYAYSIWHHKASYPYTNVGEARFCAKLNDNVFDWMTVDANRNMEMITAYDWDHGIVTNAKECRLMTTGIYKGQVEHKYDYSANQFDTLAWGWSSTRNHVGIWFINPSVEYLSCGPTKYELSAHRDATFTDSKTAPAPPCLLDYWRSSHYGGSVLKINHGEDWTKVIGPFAIYCNAAPTHDDGWHDALERSKKESAAWPYDWVTNTDYPHKNERGTVTGQLVLNDPQFPDAKMSHVLVGLAAPAYQEPGDRNGGQQTIDWDTDAKHYEFWVHANDDGRFEIPNVRPGDYTLHAIATGVLGEFTKPDIKVEPGQTLDLNKFTWQPVRFGKQLWDLGIPNRSGEEFAGGKNYYHWGMYLKYAQLFPNDVNFTIGQSDIAKDWYFEQVPHNEGDNEYGRKPGRATPWKINFNLSDEPHGTAILRLAIVGVGTKQIAVDVNGQHAGDIKGLVYNATLNRDGIAGSYVEKDLSFNASLMHAGSNTLTLTIPVGTLWNGIIYDYIRLELK